VVFSKDKDRALQIFSYTEWEPENSTAEMAKEKIQQAKSVLADLSEKSPEFGRVASSLPHEHYFCYEYGMGAVALAKEVAGQFEWQYHSARSG
jgi:hypothetical protein